MKKFFGLVLLGLCACVAQTDLISQDDDNYQDYSGILLDRPSDPNQGSGCGSYQQIIYLPDGSYTIVMVPGLCNPLYIDKGDPPPEDVGEEVVNPDPNEVRALTLRAEAIR